jgi:hypothetical protein
MSESRNTMANAAPQRAPTRFVDRVGEAVEVDMIRTPWV